jgi:hypothetical protein
VSDGASTTRPMDAGADAKRLGVAIYAIALGTDTGMVDATDNSGQLRRIPAPPTGPPCSSSPSRLAGARMTLRAAAT